MTRIMEICGDRFEVEERTPRKGEVFMNITGAWKKAEKDYKHLVLPVLIRRLDDDETVIR